MLKEGRGMHNQIKAITASSERIGDAERQSNSTCRIEQEVNFGITHTCQVCFSGIYASNFLIIQSACPLHHPPTKLLPLHSNDFNFSAINLLLNEIFWKTRNAENKARFAVACFESEENISWRVLPWIFPSLLTYTFVIRTNISEIAVLPVEGILQSMSGFVLFPLSAFPSPLSHDLESTCSEISPASDSAHIYPFKTYYCNVSWFDDSLTYSPSSSLVPRGFPLLLCRKFSAFLSFILWLFRYKDIILCVI